jgi:hypothetical protein
VVKRYARRHVVSTSQRVVRGTANAIGTVLDATGTGIGIHTSYIERLNATFRAHVVPLVRRGRRHRPHGRDAGGGNVAGRPQLQPVLAARQSPLGSASWKRIHLAGAAPAMAAGLTDHPWTLRDVLYYRVPLPAWVAPKRRGRPSKYVQRPPMHRAA